MKDITKKSDKDLESFVAEKREELRATRFGAASRNVRAVRTAKKDIARALTELTNRTRTAAPADAKEISQ